MLSVWSQISGERAVVHCAGRIVRGTEAILCVSVTSHVDKATVIVELSDVNAVDAAGLGVLALLAWWANAQAIELIVANPNSYVRNLLEITNLDTVLQVCLTEKTQTVAV
jgi:anti-anti-sigma factor